MLYNIYTTNGNVPLGITDWEHLRVMRLDYNERNIYNHRFHHDNKEQNHLFKPRSCDAMLKKIGFISRDFHESRPNGQLAIRFFSILAKYTDFEVFFYTLKKHTVCDNFNTYGSVKKGDNMENLSNMIVEDEIDILIDMQGFMVDNFKDVLLNKPAPIQMHWLGYPGTLGISTIDYLVADNIIIPDDSQKYYREKIAYLPHLYQSNNPDFIQRESYVMRQFYNISESAFVFTHFNSDYKIDRALWFVWMDILKAVPDSILVFTIMTSSTDDIFIKQLLTDASLAGMRDRVIYIPKTERHQHFNRLQLFNLGLDTYRINGHTTSADLVCAGVPFITCPTETYHNRVSHSILHELDLDDLVCEDFEMYKKKAIELATNKEYYMSVKQKIIDNREKVMFNTHHYTRSFVNMIFSIWDEYHIRDTNRKTVNHIFLNKDTNEPENKIVPFEKIKLSKFNNNYIGCPKTKWVFYENKNISKDIEPFIISIKRKQYLRDIANIQENCVAFNTVGELFDRNDGELIDMNRPNNTYNEPYGIWVKEPIPEQEQEKHISVTLNKDYNLPKICIIFRLNKNMDLNNVIKKVIEYLFFQRYINTELILVSEQGTVLPDNCYKLIIDNVNYVKLIDVPDVDKIGDTIIKNNTKSTIVIEVKEENLMDLFMIQKIYNESIKNKILCVGVGGDEQTCFMQYLKNINIKLNCDNDTDGLKHLRSPVNISYSGKIIYTYNNNTFDTVCRHFYNGDFIKRIHNINEVEKSTDCISNVDDYFNLVERTNADYFGYQHHFNRWYNYDCAKKSCQIYFLNVSKINKKELATFLECDDTLFDDFKVNDDMSNFDLKTKFSKSVKLYQQIDNEIANLCMKHNSNLFND